MHRFYIYAILVLVTLLYTSYQQEQSQLPLEFKAYAYNQVLSPDDPYIGSPGFRQLVTEKKYLN